MVLELGDIAKVSNNNTGISCDVEFKTKGFFSGTYNAINGKVRSSKGELGEVSGKWSDQMYYQKGKVRLLLLDCGRLADEGFDQARREGTIIRCGWSAGGT
jgi:hypothetical protein